MFLLERHIFRQDARAWGYWENEFPLSAAATQRRQEGGRKDAGLQAYVTAEQDAFPWQRDSVSSGLGMSLSSRGQPSKYETLGSILITVKIKISEASTKN